MHFHAHSYAKSPLLFNSIRFGYPVWVKLYLHTQFESIEEVRTIVVDPDKTRGLLTPYINREAKEMNVSKTVVWSRLFALYYITNPSVPLPFKKWSRRMLEASQWAR